jgi:hypothetical protein
MDEKEDFDVDLRHTERKNFIAGAGARIQLRLVRKRQTSASTTPKGNLTPITMRQRQPLADI